MATAEQLAFAGSFEKGALFSPCRTWRYALWRVWNFDGPMVAFIGLNPSTATEIEDDPTIRRCVGFAKRWGYGGLYMLNLFAYRATDPRVMKRAVNPVGTDNDVWLQTYTEDARTTVAAWGIHGQYHARDQHVMQHCLSTNPYCLGMTKAGAPKHPLYVPYEIQLLPYEGRD